MLPTMDPRLIELAQRAGPIASGHYRVLVLEPDARTHHHDFSDLRSAQGYAADVRHESEDDRGSPLAYLLDDGFHLLT